MANQMIALQARNPQLPDPARATAQMGQMMNMMSQQKAAERQAAQASQAMTFAANEEGRRADMQAPNLAKAGSEADSARLKYAMDFFNAAEAAISNVRDGRQAMAVGERLKQMFPEPALQQSIDETLASIPQDPAQFEAWREDSLFRTMEAKEQLAREFKTQTTGAEQREISMPKYGRGMATEVPGSRINVAEGMQYVKDDQNNVFAMPKEKPGSFNTPAPGKGGVASALQTNPGALKDGPFAKSQPGYAGASGGFATFNTPADGVAAQENLLRNAYVGKGFNTIDKIVNRYAPQGPENSAASVANYKKYIARQTGIDPNAPISTGQIPAVAQAMREFETGQTSGSGSGSGSISSAQGAGTLVLKSSAPIKAKNAAEAAIAKYDITIAVARRLLKNPSLDGILGNIQGSIPDAALNLVSQDAADAVADYNNLLSIAGFQELQDIRDASPTGGALGQVSDYENKLLQQSAFASSRTQSEAKFRRALEDYIAKVDGSRARLLRAYENQYGERIQGSPAPAPATKAKGGAAPQTPTSTLSAETRAKYGL